jgi:RNase P protein component
MKYLLYILTLLFFFECKNSSKNNQSNSKIIAKAGDESLDLDEFKEHFLSTGLKKDSMYLSKKTIDNWATESLFYQEALEKLNDDERKVDREVENYRKMLVNYIYQTKIVEANLDTNISKQEIEDYYNSHKDNFILNENIIKVNYFKIPIKAQGLDKIKKLLYANNPKEQETLRNLCVQNAENFFMNDSTWLLLDDIKKEIPKLKEQPDFNLVTGRILEFVDPQYYYYLRVKDIKNKNSISPINFERKNIKNFVINNRKTRLIREYKQLMLEKAKADKTFTTY